MFIEQQVSLQPYNTFGIAARAQHHTAVDGQGAKTTGEP